MKFIVLLKKCIIVVEVMFILVIIMCLEMNGNCPIEAREWLEQELADSDFPLRTGLHIEDQSGMVNFSVVGRNATMGERKLYVEWDNENNERNSIAKKFKKQFPSIEAVVGGETGIDIYPVGADKGQILRDFDIDNDFFFGDRMDNDGNDYS